MKIKPAYLLVALSTVLVACGETEDVSTAEVQETVEQRVTSVPAPGSLMGEMPTNILITAADCSADKLGSSIPVDAIGEPVSGVTLDEFNWVEAENQLPAYCYVKGTMTPVDTSETARNIEFGVAFPQSWSHRAGHMGGGGNNGTIPRLWTGGLLTYGFPGMLEREFVVYGSDSGHQMGEDEWTLNDEAVRNLAYMQMKKTHDAAWVLIERMYGEQPRFSYYLGRSQGGREALTVVQRYPLDYDGVYSGVPIVNFSSLQLAPEWIRIQEKPLESWVTPAKTNAIAAEVLRQCDDLDGLADGIIGNYVACRAIFDVTQGEPGRDPWATKRCPGNVDPVPGDDSVNACLTDGQIETLEFVHQRYQFATPLAYSNRSFGMWLPSTDPGGSGLIAEERFQGQEGAVADAPVHTHLGVVGVTGVLMKDLSANPLDYVEGGQWDDRRVELSAYYDGTNPDLTPFYLSGGKLISDMGTNDSLASSGAQLDYYQSVIDTLGMETVQQFARLYPMPGANHIGRGSNYGLNGNGEEIPVAPLATSYDNLAMLMNWVENNEAPPLNITAISSQGKTQKLCFYPTYPHYIGGSVNDQSSYECRAP